MEGKNFIFLVGNIVNIGFLVVFGGNIMVVVVLG